MDSLSLPQFTEEETDVQTDVQEDNQVEKPSYEDLTLKRHTEIFVSKKKPVIASDTEQEQAELAVKTTKRRVLRKKAEKIKPNESFMSMTEMESTDVPETEPEPEAEPEPEPEPKPVKRTVRKASSKATTTKNKQTRKQRDDEIYLKGLEQMQLEKLLQMEADSKIHTTTPRKLTRVRVDVEKTPENSSSESELELEPEPEPEPTPVKKVKAKPKPITKKPTPKPTSKHKQPIKPKKVIQAEPTIDYSQYF